MAQIKKSDPNFVEDEIFGLVPKDAKTARKLYLESVKNQTKTGNVATAPVPDASK